MLPWTYNYDIAALMNYYETAALCLMKINNVHSKFNTCNCNCLCIVSWIAWIAEFYTMRVVIWIRTSEDERGELLGWKARNK